MKPRSGFALIAALWLIVMLSVAALLTATTSRDRRLAVANAVEGARARAAANGALEHARSRLAGALTHTSMSHRNALADPLDPWAAPEQLMTDTFSLGDERYRVELSDVGARLNLNRADQDELTRLFRALDMDFGEADRLAQAVVDWRDEDDFRRARGAERAEYIKAGAEVLPRNGPLQRLDELLAVRGMTAALYARMAPHLILLGSGQINVNAADLPVLRALPGMTDAATAVLMQRKRAGRPVRSLDELSNTLSPTARLQLVASIPVLLPVVVFDTREVAAAADGWLSGSPVHVHAKGLFVRALSATYLVWRQTE